MKITIEPGDVRDNPKFYCDRDGTQFAETSRQGLSVWFGEFELFFEDENEGLMLAKAIADRLGGMPNLPIE